MKQLRKAQVRKDRAAPAAPVNPASRPKVSWWPWVVAGLALLLVFEVYGPALNGPFVLDDLYQFFAHPMADQIPFSVWITGTGRPALQLSYWLNFQQAGAG